jgi:phospholipid-binding lipoprotein MlaA
MTHPVRATRQLVLAALLSLMMALPGCVVLDSPEKIAQVEETQDPFEPTNRYIFELNRFLDEIVMKPVATWYYIALPNPVQDGIHNALANLRQPWTAINDIVQGNPDRAYVAVVRFAINSSIGIAGLFDVATSMGFPEHEEDAGQTFAIMGLPGDPYLVLPILGPSNPRDAAGLAVDYLIDPFNLIARSHDSNTVFPFIRGMVTGVDNRARNLDTVESLQKSSIDFYAAVRSAYRQRRDAEIRNGAPGANVPAPRISQGARISQGGGASGRQAAPAQ